MRLPRLLSRAVALAKPRLPDRAWPTLLTLRSLGSRTPTVRNPTEGSDWGGGLDHL